MERYNAFHYVIANCLFEVEVKVEVPGSEWSLSRRAGGFGFRAESPDR